MSAITISTGVQEHPNIRPLNALRDLPTVADLIELCFAPTMDNDGQRYLADMRRASRDDGFLRWASHLADSTSLPLMGFVWEENGKIIGNASLIPFRDKGKRIFLIANVATHPDHRRRGIARLLTERAMLHARSKKASALWLHVRDDNPGAIQLYADLEFQEIARRTTWTARPDSQLSKPYTDIQIVTRHPRFWIQQQDWLRRVYPENLGWYRSFSLNILKPGLMNWLYLLFVDVNIKQWAAVRGDTLLAALAWAPQGGRSDDLYAAAGPGYEPEAMMQLLIHARRVLTHPTSLTLDYPAGELTEAFTAAGFKERRTLLWMRADGAT